MFKGRLQIFSSVVLATCVGASVNGCGGGDDDTTSAGGHSAKGGAAGKAAGGKAGSSSGGASALGGSSGRGGSGGTGASSGAGGSNGGVTATGGTSNAGATTVGGSAGLASGGSTAQGGMSGVTTGGMGGMGGAPAYCYESLYVPLAMENDQADFEVDYGDTSTVNLSATTLSVRLRADTAGNAGGLQIYVKDGSAQSYATAYLGWNNLTDLSSFTTLTYDLSTVTWPSGFDATAVRYVGVNVTAGSTFDGADWQPTTVYVDSITFSDGASTNLDFNDGVPILAVNQYNSPVAGSTASGAVCQDETGTGGMGGMSGSAGTGGATAGSGGQASGTGGTEAGAAGFGGEESGGEAGATQGTGGSSSGGTGGSAGSSSGGMSGTAGTSSAGTSSAGTSSAGSAGTSGGATNLLTNGTFESDNTTGWSSWGTSTFGVSSMAHSGAYSMLVSGRTGDNINILTSITSLVSVGHTYAVSAWVRTSAATTGHFTAQIDCATATDGYPWLENPVSLDDTGWTQISGTLDFTNPCGGDTINAVNLYLEGMAENIDVYVDDVTLTQN